MEELDECFRITEHTEMARRAAEFASALVTTAMADDYDDAAAVLNDILDRTDGRESRAYLILALAHLGSVLAVHGSSGDDPFEFLQRVVLGLRVADWNVPSVVVDGPR